MRPLVDPSMFKIASTINFAQKNASLDILIDTVNILISQSALLTLKYLKNEWSLEQSAQKLPQPSFYRLHNDTNTQLNLKQLDTEETCLIKPGMSLPYTWRTHKKPQLMQLLMPKHFVCSTGFNINKNGYKEIRLQVKDSPDTFISCIIRVTGSAEVNYEKDVFFQTKIIFCNYLNTAIQDLKLSYIRNGKLYEVNSNEIAANSRSDRTFELIETNGSDKLDIDTIRINNSSILIDKKNFESYLDMFSQMKRGILCKDKKCSKVKFWFNLYVQVFNESDSDKIINQFCFIITPLFVFCSYLPYELNVEVSESDYKSQHLVESNSVVYVDDSYSSSKISVKFDQAVHNKKVSNSSREFKCLNWYEKSVEVLDLKILNVSECAGYGSMILKYADLFFYKTIANDDDEEGSKNVVADGNEFEVNLSPMAMLEPTINNQEKAYLTKVGFFKFITIHLKE